MVRPRSPSLDGNARPRLAVLAKQLVLAMPLVTLGGCAQLIGLDPPTNGGDTIIFNTGSTEPESATTKDAPLPAPQQECAADLLRDSRNCGFCGHSCGGASCDEGFCRVDVVARATSNVDRFATDGNSLFYVEPRGVRACSALGPSTQQCKSLVTANDVKAAIVDKQGQGQGQGAFGLTGNATSWLFGEEGEATPELAPRAVTISNGRVFFADENYRSIISCPTQGPCDKAKIAVMLSRETSSGLKVAPAIAASTAGAVFAVSSRLPYGNAATGRSEAAGYIAASDFTKRLIVSTSQDKSSLFWLTDTTVRATSFLPGSQVAVTTWAEGEVNDIAVDAAGVYLATNDGIIRIERSSKKAVKLVDGRWSLLALDGDALYATHDNEIARVFSGVAHTIAVAPDAVRAMQVAQGHVFFASEEDIFRVAR